MPGGQQDPDRVAQRKALVQALRDSAQNEQRRAPEHNAIDELLRQQAASSLPEWSPTNGSAAEAEGYEPGSSFEEEQNIFIRTSRTVDPVYGAEYEVMREAALSRGQTPPPMKVYHTAYWTEAVLSYTSPTCIVGQHAGDLFFWHVCDVFDLDSGAMGAGGIAISSTRKGMRLTCCPQTVDTHTRVQPLQHAQVRVHVQGLVAEDVTNLTELSRRRADAAQKLSLSPPWQVDFVQELQTRYVCRTSLFPAFFRRRE